MKKGVWGILVAFGALAAMPAWAGTVYRCESPDGTRAYVSKRVPGGQCVAIRYSKPQSTAPKPAASAAIGSATSDLKVAGSPAPVQGPAKAPAAAPKARFAGMGSTLTYSYIDASGVRHYSNVRPRGVANVKVSRVEFPIFRMENCYACGALPKVDFGSVRLNTEAYRGEIAAAAAQFGVDEAIVRAIIHAESAYRPNAVSRAGAQGLMQLMPATARRFGVADAFDPAQNIRGGVQYLGWLLKRFNGDLTLAAAGYNAGEGAVDKYKGVPPYAETQRYVQRVAVLAQRYRGNGNVAGTVAAAATAGSR